MGPVRMIVAGLLIFSVTPVSAEEASSGFPNSSSSRERLFKRATDLPIGRLNQTTEMLDMIQDEAWREVLQQAGLSFAPEGDADFKVSLNASQLEIPEGSQAGLESAGLNSVLENVSVDALVSLQDEQSSGPLGPGQIQKIDLARMDLSLGQMSLSGRGKAETDASGLMQGSVSLTVDRWREALALPAFASLNAGGQLETALEAFASDDTLNVTLQITDGKLKLGPIELAILPLIGSPG